MIDYQNSEVYFRDNFVPFEKATLSIASSPVLYGLTAYTVCNASWNDANNQMYLFRLHDHYKRLINSAKIIDFHDFAQTFSFEDFQSIIKELLQRNSVRQDALVRTAVFVDELLAGTKIHGLKTSFAAFVYPMNQMLSDKGIHVCVSSWQRTADNAIPSRAKLNGSYINSSLMKNEALQNGYDEAIALDGNGHVAESTVANVFLVRDGKLLTPDNSTDLLEGITRDSIMQLAKDLKIPIDVRPIDRSELYIADEIFLSGSSANLVPVLSVDRRRTGNGKIGPVTNKLIGLYQHLQRGEIEDTHSWLTAV